MSDEQLTKKPRSWWHWVLAATGTAAFIVLLVWGPWWIEGHHLRDGKGNLVSSAGIIVTGFRTMLVAIAAGGFTAAGLWYTHRSHQQTEKLFDHTREKDREQADLTREGQVTGRYVEAVKLLASDKTTERLGGIYALQRIMRDSEKDYPTVVEVLAAYLREPLKATRAVSQPTKIPGDRQAALNVLGLRPEYSGRDFVRVNLDGAQLPGAIFIGASWSHTSLVKSDLRGARIVDIYGASMDLSGANLDDATMMNSAMPDAAFDKASLRGTRLPGTMNGSSFYGTDLTKVADFYPESLADCYTNDETRLPAPEGA
ncbi:pentapeptide repeat-containing protein [Streptomyces asoensis]|uniref:pentapeptide repeat-containing protein n=1 Tax=Streptomyces asoensis TaxID=249586 RepID=UPI0036B9D9C1